MSPLSVCVDTCSQASLGLNVIRLHGLHYKLTLLADLFLYNFQIKSDHAVVGHTLGAHHPFYEEEFLKMGQTGGIMDYGACANRLF